MADSNNVKIVVDNKDKILDGVHDAIGASLESIGIKIEKYAKALCPVGTSESTGIKGYRGGTLRGSITHVVEENRLYAGSDVEYAPYVELGTGPYFTPPPQWESFETPKGSGIGHRYVHARPYLRPAIEDHLELYRKIIKDTLSSS
jgi:phage gpG-like protein